MPGLFAFLSTFLQGNYEVNNLLCCVVLLCCLFRRCSLQGQRLAAAAALAEMVSHSAGKDQAKHKMMGVVCFVTDCFSQLLDGLVNTLLGALTDNGLRIMCLRGLANIVGAGEHRYVIWLVCVEIWFFFWTFMCLLLFIQVCLFAFVIVCLFAGSASVNHYSQTVLDALLSAVDSNEEAVALEVKTSHFLFFVCALPRFVSFSKRR
jgi:hypothetical protein